MAETNVETEIEELEGKVEDLRRLLGEINLQEKALRERRIEVVADEIIGTASHGDVQKVEAELDALNKRKADLSRAVDIVTGRIDDMRLAADRVRFEQLKVDLPPKAELLRDKIAEYRRLRLQLLELAGELNVLDAECSRMQEGLSRRAQILGRSAELADMGNIPSVMWNSDDMRIDSERHLVRARRR